MLNASRPHGNMGKEICNKRRALWLSGSLPQGCLDDHLAVVYIYQQMVFGMGRNSGHSPGSGWPGRGWQGYSSSVLEGTGSEAETCHSSKIVDLTLFLVCKLTLSKLDNYC